MAASQKKPASPTKTQEKAPAVPEEPSKKSKKKLVVVLFLILLIFGGGGAGAYWWFFVKNASAKIADYELAGPQDEKSVNVRADVVHPVGEIAVSIVGGKRLEIGLGIEFAKPFKGSLDAVKKRMVDAIIVNVAGIPPTELASQAGKEKLKDILVRAANAVLGGEYVKGIYFMTFCVD